MVRGLLGLIASDRHDRRPDGGAGAHPAIHGLCPAGRAPAILRALCGLPAADACGLVRLEPPVGNRPGRRGVADDIRLPGAFGDRRQRTLHRVRHRAGADGWSGAAGAGGVETGPGGQFSIPPGGERVHQCRCHHHCHIPALQTVRGPRGYRRAPLRNHRLGDSGGPAIHPLADLLFRSTRLCNHVRFKTGRAAHTQRAGRRDRHDPDLLGNRLSA